MMPPVRCFILWASYVFGAAALAQPAPSSPSCQWIYPRHALAGPAECRPLAFPPDTPEQPFTLVDTAHGVELNEALTAGGRSEPASARSPDADVTRAFRLWGMRNVAHHLGRAHEYYRNTLGREAPGRPLRVELELHNPGSGLLTSSKIFLGGHSELNSEVIYHEYAHHVLEWERPGLMANRSAFGSSVTYGLIEAWANHFAFVLDNDPRYSEYSAGLHGTHRWIYSVETACTMDSCGQAVFDASETFVPVILYGAVLWDLRKRAGGAASLGIMLDSLRFLDLERPVGFREAALALLEAEMNRSRGRHRRFLIREFRRRMGWTAFP